MRRKVSLVLGLLSALVVTPATAVGAGSETSVPLPAACNTSYDPYRVDASFLASCNVVAFPLIEVKPLADGGTSYVYNVNGDLGWTNMPPAGFDPAAAGAAELATYGYPEKPASADAASLARWTESVTRINFVKPPAVMYSAPQVRFSNVTSTNWAGYYTKSGTFTKAYLTYTFADIVGPPAPPCSASGAVGAWTGLGGAFSSELAQNGTAIGAAGIGYFQGWWEILPGAPVTVPFYGTWNKSTTVFTTRNNNGTFTFQWFNNYDDSSYTWNQTSSHYSGSSADFIIERPRLAGGGYENMDSLINPQTFRGSANSNPINNYAFDKVTMVNATGQTLFSVSGLQSDGSSFTTTQNRCA